MKHGIPFEEARTIFRDPLSVTVRDPDPGLDEVRYVIIGLTDRGRVVVVVHVEQGETIRIVSARTANRRERRIYEETQDDGA